MFWTYTICWRTKDRHGSLEEVTEFDSYFEALTAAYRCVVECPDKCIDITIHIRMHQVGFEGFELVDNPCLG